MIAMRMYPTTTTMILMTMIVIVIMIIMIQVMIMIMLGIVMMMIKMMIMIILGIVMVITMMVFFNIRYIRFQGITVLMRTIMTTAMTVTSAESWHFQRCRCAGIAWR